MKYLVFATPNSNHFLFLSFSILLIIRTIITEQSQLTQDIVENFHFSYLYSLSDFLSIIPIIIINKRSKSSKIQVLKQNKSIKRGNLTEGRLTNITQEKNNTNKKKKKIFLLFFVVSILDFLAQYIQLIFFIIQKKSNEPIKILNLNCILIIHIIAQYLFNRIILHYFFYRHHYLSLFINVIFLIILGAIDIRDIYLSDNKPIISLFYVLTTMLYMIFYSIEDAFAKIILTYNSISPYLYLLYKAIIVNFFVLIFAIVFIFVDIPDENGENSCVYTRFWKLYEDKKNIILYIGYFIVGFLFDANIFFIIDKFSSSHLAASNIFGNFGVLLCSFIFFQNIDTSEFFLRFALFIILTIAASIHNEFIILKFCGLEKHTKLFLEGEAENDINQIPQSAMTLDTAGCEDNKNLENSLIELDNYYL